MRQIPLNAKKAKRNGEPVVLFLLVDDEDYDYLSGFSWSVVRRRHTCYAVGRVDGKYEMIHRVIMKPPKGMVVDHINGDGLDNRRQNMRLCTTKENIRNRRKNRNNTSGFKGVYWNKSSKKWLAAIIVNAKSIHLGLYEDVNDAAEARRQAEVRYYGEFARLE